MTEITIDKWDGKHVLVIRGHAGYSKCGTDIVCAGISTLGYTLINVLRELEKRGLAEKVSCGEGAGSLIITFYGESAELKAAYETVLIGFYMLQEKFSSYLRISRGENIF